MRQGDLFACARRAARSARALSLGVTAAALTGAAAAATEPTFEIKAIDVDGNTLLDERTLERAIYPHMGPGRTRDDVIAAQQALEKAYHDHGYQSVVVEVPRQSVAEGLIKLHVVEAPIGRVRVVGSKYHSPAQLEAAIPALAEGAVADFNKAQAEITESNRLPDRQTTPVVRAGETPGTVDVDLQVADQEPLHGSLELNNDHSAFTTPLRLTANLRYDNLWQLGQSISGTYSVAPERRKDAEIYAGSYVAPIWGTPFSVLVFGYDSHSDVASLGGVNVLGPGHSVGARAVYQFAPAGALVQSLTFGIDYKSFKEVDYVPVSENGGAPQLMITGGAVTYFPLVATYAARRQVGEMMTSATVGVTANLRPLGYDDTDFQTKRANASAEFMHVNLDLEHQQPLWRGFQADFRFSGQLTDHPLVSSEQFAAGGLSSVRGYLSAEAVGDDGVFGSLELRSPLLFARWKGLVDDTRLYSFFDAADVWVLAPLQEQTSRFLLYSTGLGLRFRLLDHFTGDVNAAVPLIGGPFRPNDRPYTTFSLKTDF